MFSLSTVLSICKPVSLASLLSTVLMFYNITCEWLKSFMCERYPSFGFTIDFWNPFFFLMEWQIVRLLANHPHFGVTLMTADRKAGQSMDSVFPHLRAQVLTHFFYLFQWYFVGVVYRCLKTFSFCPQKLPRLISVKDADFSTVDAVFCCLPHGTTQVLFLFFWFFPLQTLFLSFS